MQLKGGFMEKAPQREEKWDHSRLVNLHPLWLSFMRYCESMDNGEIDILKIQDGLPVFAEETRDKVEFG